MIGTISISNALTILPALLITLFVCIYGLFKIPELTSAILSGRTGTWVNRDGRLTMSKTQNDLPSPMPDTSSWNSMRSRSSPTPI